MEAGRSTEEIGETVDARELQTEIIAIMKCHKTQRSDYEQRVINNTESIGLDHFIVLT